MHRACRRRARRPATRSLPSSPTTCSRRRAAGPPRPPGGRCPGRRARDRRLRVGGGGGTLRTRARRARRPRPTMTTVRAEALLGLGRARLLVGDAPAAGRGFEQCGRARAHEAVGRAPGARRARVQRRPLRVRGAAVRPAPDRPARGSRRGARRIRTRRAPRDRPGPAVGRAVVERARSPPARAGRDGRRAGPRNRRALRTRALPGRALRRARVTRPRRAQRLAEATEIVAIGEREGDAPLELLGRRLRFVALLERGRLHGSRRRRRRRSRVGPRRSAIRSTPGTCRCGLGSARSSTATSTRAKPRSRRPGYSGAPPGARTPRCSPGAVARRGVGRGRLRRWPAGDRAAARGEPGARGCICRRPVVTRWSYSLAGRVRKPTRYSTGVRPSASTRCRSTPNGCPTWYALLMTPRRQPDIRRSPMLVDELRPYVDLVAFEGIGAGLYGSVARYVARGMLVVGANDEAVDARTPGRRREPAGRRAPRCRRDAHTCRVPRAARRARRPPTKRPVSTTAPIPPTWRRVPHTVSGPQPNRRSN